MDSKCIHHLVRGINERSEECKALDNNLYDQIFAYINGTFRNRNATPQTNIRSQNKKGMRKESGGTRILRSTFGRKNNKEGLTGKCHPGENSRKTRNSTERRFRAELRDVACSSSFLSTLSPSYNLRAKKNIFGVTSPNARQKSSKVKHIMSNKFKNRMTTSVMDFGISSPVRTNLGKEGHVDKSITTQTENAEEKSADEIRLGVDELSDVEHSNVGDGRRSNNVSEEGNVDKNITIYTDHTERHSGDEICSRVQRLCDEEQSNVRRECNHVRKLERRPVTLVRVNPSLTDLINCASKDLVRGFCGGCCLGLSPYSDLVWLERNDQFHPFCPGCYRKGLKETVILNFWFELVVNDGGRIYEAVCSREYAAKFLGFTMYEFLDSKRIRQCVYNKLQSLIDMEESFYLKMIEVQNCLGVHHRVC